MKPKVFIEDDTDTVRLLAGLGKAGLPKAQLMPGEK